MFSGTVRSGLKDMAWRTAPDVARGSRARQRAPGGGRKPLDDHDPGLLEALERCLDPLTRDDPKTPLRRTCGGAARLAEELPAGGHPVGERRVNRLQPTLGCSLQTNRKTVEGRRHPDRDAQFGRPDLRARAFRKLGQPAVSVDTRKKDPVGSYRDGGKKWRPKKADPEAVNVRDFSDPDLNKAIASGVYDIAANAGWVSVGPDPDTASFAVETLYAAGGDGWGVTSIRKRHTRWAPSMVADRTSAATGCGSSKCKGLPTNLDWKFRCAASRTEPASGARSSTACLALSSRTGGALL